MLGVRNALTLLLLTALVVVLASGPAAAQAPADGGPVCTAVEQRLAEVQRTLQTCEHNRQTITEERSACRDDLASTSDKLTDTQSRAEACQTAKDSLCTEAAEFARELLKGHVSNVGACVPGAQQSALATLLRGWENSSSALSQLGAFGAGETDVLPSVPGNTASERLVARLLGTNQREPLLYRRLLSEAMKLTAPQAWNRLRAAGPASIEAWFNSTAPLDAKLVEEAQREHTAPPGPAGPPLSAALRLVSSFLLVARCQDDAPTSSCTRAKQLQQLLESTGPLLVRRRVEDIWSSECTNTGPETVLAWVQDFPTPHTAARPSDYTEVAAAAQAKLFTCFLGDAGSEPSFRAWLDQKLPGPKKLNARTLPRIDGIRAHADEGTPTDICGRAVRAMQELERPATCVAPPAEIRGPIERWAAIASTVQQDDSVPLQACREYARLLWEGRGVTIAGSYARPPTVDEMVFIDARVPENAFARLRQACQERHGTGRNFAENLSVLSTIARGFGESPDGTPWRVDPVVGGPVEAPRFTQAATYGAWAKQLVSRENSCQALGMVDARCQQCLELPRETFYDCSLRVELESIWTQRGRVTIASVAAALGGLAFLVWLVRLVRARRTFKTWSKSTLERLGTLGLTATPDPLRILLPARHDVLTVDLPRDPAWERWGTRACVVRAHAALKVQDSDVNHAVAISQRLGVRVVFLLHDDAATLDLGAVRAILDWAAKGGNRTMHVLPVAVSRLAWARSATDLLDLVEETSLRGNPFEVRGRITSSSQFWNRERLVSGLLAETRAGRWLVVTGLRRFGKSSLALEVARRLPGPSAYVDLAGFHHEFAFLDDPARAVDAVLRSLCARLSDSARALYPSAVVPEPPTSEIDAAALTRWVRDLSAACLPFSDGRPPPMLLVLDEIEQVLAIGPHRLGHVLDVLAILLGRLRNAVGDAPHPEGSSPVGILLCSALHPLLWAPLRTLGQQSIIGAFPAVCVPNLSPEAAGSMMRGLGARQGIRFTDAALEHILQEAQGVPLLLRRIGTSVLELYDADHARQGSLGAVQVGIEGAREAVEREEREGSPLRVWVESEIAESTGPGGAMLRKLANEGRASAASLREIAERQVLAQFASTGVTSHLPAEELRRRAQEAASVMLRLLGETGLLQPVGDLTAPEAYELPDGSIRRVLRLSVSARSINASPSVRPEP